MAKTGRNLPPIQQFIVKFNIATPFALSDFRSKAKKIVSKGLVYSERFYKVFPFIIKPFDTPRYARHSGRTGRGI